MNTLKSEMQFFCPDPSAMAQIVERALSDPKVPGLNPSHGTKRQFFFRKFISLQNNLHLRNGCLIDFDLKELYC